MGTGLPLGKSGSLSFRGFANKKALSHFPSDASDFQSFIQVHYSEQVTQSRVCH